jgi:N-acyl homoserine lactone hydrolase
MTDEATMTRRSFLRVAASGLGAALTGGASAPRTHAALHVPSPTSVTLGKITLHAIQTGWVSVKEAHRSLASPAALRLPSIMLDGDWTEWLPVHAWLIEHPEGLILVDTGERHEAMRAEFFDDVDAGNAFFYRKFLRFRVEPEEEIGPQIERLGMRPAEVQHVVMTHLHSDHADGMHMLPAATFHISRAELDPSLPGNLAPKWPAGLKAALIDHAPDDTPGFGASYALTRAGDIRLLPTPGHSAGHQSVLIRAGDTQIILAGDASFDQEQLVRGAHAGICADLALAQRSHEALRALARAAPTLYLPTHDARSAARLRDRSTI